MGEVDASLDKVFHDNEEIPGRAYERLFGMYNDMENIGKCSLIMVQY